MKPTKGIQSENCLEPGVESPRFFTEQLDQVQNKLVELGDILQRLESRLGPLLGPSLDKEPSNVVGEKGPPRSEFSNRLVHLEQHISELIDRVHSLQTRIEI